MKTTLVATANFKRATFEIERCVTAGKLALIEGLPGLGKTAFAQQLVTRRGAAYVRARADWTSRTGLAEILDLFNPPRDGERRELRSTPFIYDALKRELIDARLDAGSR